MLKFNKEKVGGRGAKLNSYNPHEPTIITIQHAIWEEKDERKFLKLLFKTDKISSALEIVNVSYEFNGSELAEAVLLHNLVFLLDLKDEDGDRGFRQEERTIKDKVWNSDKKTFEMQDRKVLIEPQLTNTEIGVIFFEDYYFNPQKNQILKITKIYDFYDIRTMQTADCVTKGKIYQKGEEKHLLELCEIAKTISLDKQQIAKENQEKENETRKQISQMETPVAPVVENPTIENMINQEEIKTMSATETIKPPITLNKAHIEPEPAPQAVETETTVDTVKVLAETISAPTSEIDIEKDKTGDHKDL